MYFNHVQITRNSKSKKLSEKDFAVTHPKLREYITMLESYGDVLTTSEARQALGVSKRTMNDYISQKRIRTVFLHEQIHLIPKVWLIEFFITIETK